MKNGPLFAKSRDFAVRIINFINFYAKIKKSLL